jgi:organic radical activating enzyme
MLQLDAGLVDALRARGFLIAIETNGTLPVLDGIDWICVSPKAHAPLVVTRGDELKLVYPQQDAAPERFEGLDFRYFSLQPMDGPTRELNTRLALEYCKAHPRWRLSLQVHKLLGIP